MAAFDDPERRRAARVAFVVALAPLLALAARFWFTCDDAFISFRYARHLAEGAGLVFNRGESPPVEGFSNLLWVLWTAPWIALGVDPALAANATSLACAVVLLALVARAGASVSRDAASAVLATLAFAASPTVAVWSTSGLETMAFALALFGLFEHARRAHASRRGAVAGAVAWSAFAALVRADGVAWALVALACAWIATPRDARALARRPFAAAGATLALAALGVGLWRWSTYGELAPNTAHVKAATSALRLERGARYVATLALALPSAWIALGWALARARPPARRLALAAGAFALVTVAYSIWTGGDFMAMGRFLAPLAPFAALALAAVLASETARVRLAGAAALVALSLAACFDVTPLPASAREALHFRWNEPSSRSEVEQWRGMRDRAREWRALGRALALHTRPGETIVLGNVGAIGYETELTLLDVFGLTDRDVARRRTLARASPGHDKGVPLAWFLPRRPDYLGAWIAPEDAPDDAGLQGAVGELVRSGAADVARFALPPAEFGSRATLRVVRLRAPR